MWSNFYLLILWRHLIKTGYYIVVLLFLSQRWADIFSFYALYLTYEMDIVNKTIFFSGVSPFLEPVSSRWKQSWEWVQCFSMNITAILCYWTFQTFKKFYFFVCLSLQDTEVPGSGTEFVQLFSHGKLGEDTWNFLLKSGNSVRKRLCTFICLYNFLLNYIYTHIYISIYIHTHIYFYIYIHTYIYPLHETNSEQ